MEEETVSIGTKRILLDMKYKGDFKQSVVQKWLRDKHGFFVLVGLDHKGLYYHICNGKIDYKGDHYLSYESALDMGLQMALRYI